MSSKQIVCTGCNTTLSLKSANAMLFACTHCGHVVINETGLTFPDRPHPTDWSVIQSGTTGIAKTKPFEVIGRVRLQMQKEYKNYWCLWYEGTKEYGWLIESFGFYALCPGTLFEMKEKNDLKRLKAGKVIDISKQTTLALDDEDHCEALSYSGELNDWSFYAPNFNVVHGCSDKTVASFFHVSTTIQLAKFFVGEWTTWELLQLKNLKKDNEW